VPFEAIMAKVDELNLTGDRIEGVAAHHFTHLRSTRIHCRKCSCHGDGIGSSGGDKAANRWRERLPTFRGTDLIGCDRHVVGRLPILPISDLFSQTFHATQSFSDSLPLFGRSTVIHGKHVLPFAYFGLGYLKSLLYFGPVCFENSGLVSIVPNILGGQGNLGISFGF
jgi:hypothetical protein